jgi:hypothetical protein
MAHITFTTLEKLIHLLRSAPVHEGTYVRVLGPSQLGLGSDPLRPSHTLDLAKEAVVHHFQDEAPMDLGPSAAANMEGSGTNGASASHSKDEQPKETKPPAQKSNNKLMERLDAAVGAK